MALSDLVAKLGLDITNFQQNIGIAQGSLDELGSSAQKAGVTLTASITAPLTAIGVAAVAAWDQVDQGLDTIRIKTGQVGPELDKLQVSFQNVFKDVPQTAAEVGQAISGISVATGLVGPQLEAMSTTLLNLARIQKTDITPLVGDVTRAFNNWGIATDEQSGKLDELFRASQASGVSVSSLAQQVTSAGLILRGLGIDFDTTVALLASFAKNGIDADSAMVGLKRSLSELAKAGITDTKAAIDEIVSSIKNADTASQATAFAINAFGQKAGPQLAQAIREGRLEIGDFLAKIQSGTDTINTATKDTDDFKEAWGKFKNELILALTPLGQVAADLLPKLLAAMQPLIGIVTDLATQFEKLNPSLQAAIIAIAGAAAAIGPLLVGFGLMANGVSSLLPLLGSLTTALGAGAGLTGVIIGLAGAATIAVETGFGEWLGKLTATALGVGPTVTKQMADMGDAIQNNLGKSVTAATTSSAAFTTAWTASVKAVTDGTNAYGLAGTAIGKTAEVQALLKKNSEDAKAALEAQKEATQLLATTEAQLDAAYKSLLLPTITDVKTAEDNLAISRNNVKTATDNVVAAETALETLMANKAASTDAIKTATVNLTDARLSLKLASDDLKTREDDLTKSQNAHKQAISDLAAAEADLTAAYRATHIPAITDLKTAEDNVKAARDKVAAASDIVRDSEDALSSLRFQEGVKSAEDLVAAEDDLKQKRLDLKGSVEDLKTAESDLKTSRESLKAATEAMNASQADLDKEIADNATPAAKNLANEEDNLRTAYRNQQAAVQDVIAAQQDLTQAMADGDPTAIKDATDGLAASRTKLKEETDKLHSAETQISGDFGATAGQIDAVKKSSDDTTIAVGSMQKALDSLSHKAIDDLGTGLADVVLKGKSFSDVLVQIGKDIIATFIEIGVKKVLQFITDAITGGGGLLGALSSVMDAIKGIGSAIGGIFSSSGQGIGGAIGGLGGLGGLGSETIDNAGLYAGEAGSALGSAGSIVGSLAGALSPIGAIGAAVGAISGIVGNFQMAGLNDTINAMERETARMAIYLGDQTGNSIQYYTGKASETLSYVQHRLESILKDLDPGGSIDKYLSDINFNTFWALKKFDDWHPVIMAITGEFTVLGGMLNDGFNSVVDELKNAASILSQINSGVMGMQPAFAAAGPTGGANITINATSSDAKTLAQQIVDALRLQGAIK